MPVIIDGTLGITLPTGSTAVGTTDTQTLSNKTIGGGYAGSTIVSGTSQATTSGTAIDFTGIPSWVKRITVMFNGVSTNGTSQLQIQIGAGSIVTTGYNSGAQTGPSYTAYTTGFGIVNAITATDNYYGTAVLTLVSGATWEYASSINRQGAGIILGAGGITLGGTLDRVRITTVNGTDAFDAGSVNILYE